jgi:uncharacterized protein YbjT (DUF2867 family)
MITVVGATGNTGRKIIELRPEAGEEVRALGRLPEKLAEFDALGAKTVAATSATPTIWQHLRRRRRRAHPHRFRPDPARLPRRPGQVRRGDRLALRESV